MTEPKTVFLVLVIFFAAIPRAAAAPAAYRLDKAASKIEFTAKSTLHGIHGTAQEMDGDVTFDFASGISQGPLRIEIPVSGLETGNGKRDKAMMKMFHAWEYPSVTWEGQALACVPGPAESWTCEAKGNLSIRGISREKTLLVALKKDGDGVRASGSVPLSLAEFALEPPSVAGIIRVSDPVTLDFDTVWLPEAA